MTVLSYSQQQLLKVLQITPLRPTERFTAQPQASVAVETLLPDLNLALAQDIALLLTDKLTWHIQPDLAEPQLLPNQLLTPPLAVLQQAAQKKALWSLLSSANDI